MEKIITQIVLSACYSIDSQENLLIYNRPLISTAPKTICHSKIDQIIFNINGDILIFTEDREKTGWHRFSKQGIDMGLIREKDWKSLQKKYPDFHYGKCSKYEVDTNGIVTIYLPFNE